MSKLIKKNCEKIYISPEKYGVLEFIIEEHFSELNRNSLKEKKYNSEEIAKLWVEDYIDRLYKKYEQEQRTLNIQAREYLEAEKDYEDLKKNDGSYYDGYCDD
ncbi:MAG: hypothetical protein ACRDA5_02320 [Clostridium sp.]